jgi:hypothetical protein
MHRFLASVFATTGARPDELATVPRLGVFGMVLLTVFAAYRMARARYGEGRPDDWEAREPSMPGHGVGASLR